MSIHVTVEVLGQRLVMTMNEWQKMEPGLKSAGTDYKIIFATKHNQ